MENYQTILGTQGQDTLVNLISIKLPACAVKPLASVKCLHTLICLLTTAAAERGANNIVSAFKTSCSGHFRLQLAP